MDCMNLREQFGRRYRITFDPAYDPKHRPREKLDPWMMQIPCRFGTVYPYGGTRLAIDVNRHPIIANRLRGMDCLTVVQDGDHEVTLVFDVEDFSTVAKIVHPNRRAQMSEEQKRKAVERLSAYRFQSRSDSRTLDAVTHARGST